MGGACGMKSWDALCRICRKQWNKARGRTRHEWEDDIKMVLNPYPANVENRVSS